MPLQEKIKITSLLTDEEKEQILAKYDTFTEEQLDELEETIDDYEESIAATFKKYGEKMKGDLEKLAKSDKPEEKALAQEVSSLFE